MCALCDLIWNGSDWILICRWKMAQIHLHGTLHATIYEVDKLKADGGGANFLSMVLFFFCFFCLFGSGGLIVDFEFWLFFLFDFEFEVNVFFICFANDWIKKNLLVVMMNWWLIWCLKSEVDPACFGGSVICLDTVDI